MPKQVGIFLDISNTLTKKAVISYYSNRFGFGAEFSDLEQKFSSGYISSEQYSHSLGELLRCNNVTRGDLVQIADSVELRPGTREFLSFSKKYDIDIYLVSATPDFFVHEFAQKFGIPVDRCLSSQTNYDEHGIVCSIEGITSNAKVNYVREKSQSYKLSVGVGDNLIHDGGFVSACDMSFMVLKPGENHIIDETYIYAVSIVTVKDFIKQIYKIYLKSSSLFYHIKFAISRFAREKFLAFLFSAMITMAVFLAALTQIATFILDKILLLYK